ncbi:MAG: M48 family metallopeptidase [Smithellaceae bacterium]|nr:M48 family metallopeptidase [Smithellaceae bacterium]
MTGNRSTNFFARQRDARKSCRNQMILFALAVFIIVLITTMAIRLAWYLFISTQAHTLINYEAAQKYQQKLAAFTFFDPAFFLFMALVIISLILATSLIKMNRLQKGGGAVAEMLGGRKISAATTDQSERRLMNVVEEMAIASGIPVPQVYVLDSEHNINAFAAGLEITDSAVAVTKGTLNKLNRDELQGVIGHEFSHILNGDARLNVQLIGILFGIMFMGIIGRQILSHGRFSARMGLPVIAAGVCLMGIGYIGTFMGRLMQCAISRQKEFLADASAVQFTRNPLGLAGALKKIGGSSFGSQIKSPGASQASHLFFSESHPDKLFAFLATHPPLAERVRLLDPSFNGTFTKMEEDAPRAKPEYSSPFWGTSRWGTKLHVPAGSPLMTILPADVVNHVGNPSKENIEQSRTFLDSIPEEIAETVKSPQGAACVIYALLMDHDAALRSSQLSSLERAMVVRGRTDNILKIAGQLSGLEQNLRLPLIELAMPALKGLASMEKRNFLLILHSCANVDGRVSLFELSVLWILEKYLNPSEELFRSVTIFSFSRVGLDIVVLLQALACTGHADKKTKAEQAFHTGLARIPELAARKPVFAFEEIASYASVHKSLTRLGEASFKIRESVIDACAHCAFSDQDVTVEERELLRVIALALQCPLPPFLEAPPEEDAA